MYRRRRAPGVGLLFLISQLYNVGFHRIPPVTLSVIAINVAVYLRLLNNLPSVGKACVSAHYVWFNGDWKRLVFAAFYHLDDFHLYYNMASFVWKGMSLERTLGSPNFLYVLTVFTVLTNAVLVGLDVALANVTENSSYIFSCAAGFSGVIFALKVLTTYNLPSDSTRVMGLFSIPLRWAYWFELILIQVIVPNASFTGHLAGILVGLMYVKGPLRHIMDAASALVSGSGVTRGTRPSYTYHTGTTGQRQDGPHRPPRARVSDSESEDQELQQAIRASLLETHINRAPFPDDYNPQLQSAIRDSLDSSGETQSRWSNGASSKSAPCSTQQTTHYPRLHDPPPKSYTNEHFAGSSPYPAQGKALHTRIPHSYTGETSVQSPPYPTEEEVRFPEPSAPPLVPDNPLPYPRDNRMPAPDSSDSIGRRGLAPGSLNEVRRRRLERFER